MNVTAEPLEITPIGEVVARSRYRVRGRVRSIRVRPWADVATLEVVIVDGTGGINLVFLSRRRIGGIKLGSYLSAEGVAVAIDRRLAILNPMYDLLPDYVPAEA